MTDTLLSKSEIERLGDRLRASSSPTEADLQLLQRLRLEYEHALAETQHVIVSWSAQLHPTSRLKTIQTIVDKLKRNPTMNLQQIQDIAGLRVVGEMTLPEQDELASGLAALFEKARVVDRRPSDKASHGYRAIHVIAKIGGRPVEIQVRTVLQDRWAQITEKLGDAWGRQIRYGEPPDQPDGRIGPLNRVVVCDMVGTISQYIAWCEEDPLLKCTLAHQTLRRLALTLTRSGVVS